MLNKNDIKALKREEIKQILLVDGYILTKNDKNNEIYLSKGGKKKFFISKRLLYNLCSNKYNKDMKLFVYIITEIIKISSRLKKESKTRIRLEQLLKDICKMYE